MLESVELVLTPERVVPLTESSGNYDGADSVPVSASLTPGQTRQEDQLTLVLDGDSQTRTPEEVTEQPDGSFRSRYRFQYRAPGAIEDDVREINIRGQGNELRRLWVFKSVPAAGVTVEFWDQFVNREFPDPAHLKLATAIEDNGRVVLTGQLVPGTYWVRIIHGADMDFQAEWATQEFNFVNQPLHIMETFRLPPSGGY